MRVKISWRKSDGHQLDGWPYTKHLKVSQVKKKLIGYRWYSSCGLRWLVAPELLPSPSPISYDKDAPSEKCPSQLYNCQIHCMIYQFNLIAIVILCLSYTFGKVIYIWKWETMLTTEPPVCFSSTFLQCYWQNLTNTLTQIHYSLISYGMVKMAKNTNFWTDGPF